MTAFFTAALRGAAIQNAVNVFWDKFVPCDIKRRIKADFGPIQYEYAIKNISDKQFVIGMLEVSNKWLPFVLGYLKGKK